MKAAVASVPLRDWLLKKPVWLDHQTKSGGFLRSRHLGINPRTLYRILGRSPVDALLTWRGFYRLFWHAPLARFALFVCLFCGGALAVANH
jgi:hypothetical protein